jgi:hypothetical protein
MKVVKYLACVRHWCGINLDWVYSLNHCTSPSFVAQEITRFLGNFPKLCQQGLLECCKDASICTSAAYEGCQTPCMCLTLIWDQSRLGLQPQSLHFTIISCPEVTQISRWLVPNALSAGAAGMLLGRINMQIHSIWRLSNTLHVSDIDVGSVFLGLQPQSLHFTIICCPEVTQISRWLSKSWSMRAAIML